MATRRRSRIFQDRDVPARTPKIVVEERVKKKKQRTKQRQRKKQPRTQVITNHVVPSRDHEGKVAVCFASGPGLTPEVLDLVRPYHEAGRIVTCGLNDTYRIVDFLDEFYACDQHWWKFHLANPSDAGKHGEKKRHVLDDQPNTRIWGNHTAARTLNQYSRINVVRGQGGTKGFSEDPQTIRWGSNSGFQLLNLTLHFGVSKMLLVGYNMCVPNKGGLDAHHFFGPHPKPMSQSGAYKGFVKQYHHIQGNFKKMIVNCTPDSALDCFEMGDLKTELDKTCCKQGCCDD